MYIDTHYAEAIDLDAISGEAWFSKFHFIRCFKKIFGLTPHQYLIKVRVQNAMRLLQEGTAVNAVCFSVGFESATSFTSLFKKMCGSSPSVYRDANLKRRETQQREPLQHIPGCYVAMRS
jgi:AraC-like DNA-binding protein